MILSLIKTPFRRVRKAYRDLQMERYLERRTQISGRVSNRTFEFGNFKNKVVSFINAMRTDSSGFRYRYSISSTRPTLYASAYACMTYGLLGELRCWSVAEKQAWVDYFDSFQSEHDGLFYDQVVMNELYADTDWWGARHLALHMIIAYSDLGAQPKHPFRFLEKYYDLNQVQSWLDGFNWMDEAFADSNDIDNKIMNIGCLLQYQRDTFADKRASDSVELIKDYLYERINPATGLWGAYNHEDMIQRSRMVQFAYHLFPLYFHDNNFSFDHEKILGHVLSAQNKYGGYGATFNSSACEDIDSIDLLIRLYPYAQESLRIKIDESLRRAKNWVLLNQMDDGGFVFRLNESMKYGHQEMMSLPNKSAMFPTWFRTLSLALLDSRHKTQKFNMNPVPGYVVHLND